MVTDYFSNRDMHVTTALDKGSDWLLIPGTATTIYFKAYS